MKTDEINIERLISEAERYERLEREASNQNLSAMPAEYYAAKAKELRLKIARKHVPDAYEQSKELGET